MKKRLLQQCVVIIAICGVFVSCKHGMGNYVYVDGCSTLHVDKDCKGVAVFRGSTPLRVFVKETISSKDWHSICSKCVSNKDYETIEYISKRNQHADANKRSLYNSLRREYDMGTFEQFLVDIENDDKRHKLYDAIKDEYGYSSYNAFSLYLKGYNISSTGQGNDDRRWLYERMRQAGVNTGSYDEFTASLNDKEDRDWYYQKSIELGFDVGSADEFAEMMGIDTAPAAHHTTEEDIETEEEYDVDPSEYMEYDLDDDMRFGRVGH